MSSKLPDVKYVTRLSQLEDGEYGRRITNAQVPSSEEGIYQRKGDKFEPVYALGTGSGSRSRSGSSGWGGGGDIEIPNAQPGNPAHFDHPATPVRRRSPVALPSQLLRSSSGSGSSRSRPHSRTRRGPIAVSMYELGTVLDRRDVKHGDAVIVTEGRKKGNRMYAIKKLVPFEVFDKVSAALGEPKRGRGKKGRKTKGRRGKQARKSVKAKRH
jgi:hypothetical protein